MAQLTGTKYLSDLTATFGTNGLGPVEKDRSVGGLNARDGKVLTLNGVTYNKGLGVNARSEIRYNLAGSCSSFNAFVGIDDEVGDGGSAVFQVFADSVKVFDSGVLRGSSATQTVNVNMAGKYELKIIVTDAGDGNANDHADWANAHVSCGVAPGGRYISDMSWTSSTNGLGPVEKDRSNGGSAAGDGQPLTIAGRVYSKGLGVKANSEIRYNLGGNCSTFYSEVGIDDEVDDLGSAVFEVLADGTSLYRSGTLAGHMGASIVSVNISGRSELVLKVSDGGSRSTRDRGDWANAQLTCASDTTAPTILQFAPAQGSTAVATSAAISVVFSEAMDPVSLSSSTFLLVKQGNTIPVNASVTYDSITRIATLRPAAALDVSSVYVAVVKGLGVGVRDVAGNPLVSDAVWNLTTAGTSSYVTSPPIVLDGKQQIVISGVVISNPNGPCIEIKGNSQNITVRNSKLGPCGGAGVQVTASKAVTIEGVHIFNTGGNGVTVYAVDGINILDNRIENVQSGVHALESKKVNVAFNSFLNTRGPMPRGQFVQFDKVSGGGNRIKCNTGENVAGLSYPEDAISLFQTNGEAADPVHVVGNKIKGGGPSMFGGGIMLGDAGGSNQLVEDNILVDPGQYGIAVSSGTNMTIRRNMIYARMQPFTNVGLSVWNQYTSSCGSVTVEQNLVNWISSSGSPNPGWNAGNCGTVNGWANNNPQAVIGAGIFDQPIAACQR